MDVARLDAARDAELACADRAAMALALPRAADAPPPHRPALRQCRCRYARTLCRGCRGRTGAGRRAARATQAACPEAASVGQRLSTAAARALDAAEQDRTHHGEQRYL